MLGYSEGKRPQSLFAVGTSRGGLCVAFATLGLVAGGLIGASLRVEPAAIEARLIGECDGRIMAALEESSFPAGCEWIEPIRFEPEAMAPDEFWQELEAAAILKRGLVNPMTGKAAQ